MLLVVPTYRRTHCLKVVLQSILHATRRWPVNDLRVLVVSNHPPTNADVRAAVESTLGGQGIEFRVLAREKSLDPVENWYSAITENSAEGESVLLHGDDDLMLAWGIGERARLIETAGADMLLTPAHSRVIFSRQGARSFLTSALPVPAEVPAAQPWDYRDPTAADAVFIGCHTYCNTTTFRQALASCYEICNRQAWLDKISREAMLPLYLPFMINQLGGSVVQANLPCVVRGGDLEEILSTPFGVRSWNSALLDLLAIGVFRHGWLGDSAALRRHGRDRIVDPCRLIPPLLVDPKVSRKSLDRTLDFAGLQRRDAFGPRALGGWIRILENSLGLLGRRAQLRVYRHAVPSEDLVQQIAIGEMMPAARAGATGESSTR